MAEETAYPLSPERDIPPEWFWEFTRAVQCDPSRVPAALAEMDAGAIARLYWTFDWAVVEVAYSDEFAEACMPEATEDSLLDAAEWIICRGQEIYERAVDAPDASLCAYFVEGRSPLVKSAIHYEYDRRFGTDIPFAPD